MLQPARTKYRKQQKGRNTGVATRGAKVSFGEFGLKATTRGRLTARQLEAGRRAMSRHIKRGGRIWIRVFPDKPVSQKPAEVRMGNGKGNPEYFVSEIQPGKIIFEMDGVTPHVAAGHARRVTGADDRADGSAGNRHGLHAHLVERLGHDDMREPSRAAAAKCEGEGFHLAPASRAKRHAVSASGRTIWPLAAACSLVAVPSRTRPAMPCKIAAIRKKL